MKQLTELTGEVADIIYKNETSGYVICTIYTTDDEVTVVGFLPYVSSGENIRVMGNWVNHPDYGKQFKAETFEKLLPQGIPAIERYLSSGILKGVGLATARKFTAKFGLETIEVIRNTPERLAEVRGVSYEKAMSISQALNEQWDLWKLVSFVGNYGIGNKNAVKLYKNLGEDALTKIKENPYIILEHCVGVSFKVADKIAMDVGVDKNNEIRIKAGVKYALSLASAEGHTYLPKAILIEYLLTFLEVEEDAVLSGITGLAIEGKIKIYENEKIYLLPLYQAEKNVALRLTEMGKIKSKFKVKTIATELENGIVLTKEQEECVKKSFDSQIFVITGGPGTGKTTIVKAIIKTLEEFEAKVVLCAPTGRAAKRLSEASGIDAKTIHRLLEIKHIDDEDRNSLVDAEVVPIEADTVIVDEVSMLDAVLMNNLLKAISPSTNLILVGDADQLPSVGPGNVLRDIIDSGKVNVFSLNEIFRQAKESMIIVNAHNINTGEMPEFNQPDTDSFLVKASSYDQIMHHVIHLTSERLPQFKDYHPTEDIQVITPMRKGLLGANNLNKELQKVLNPYKGDHRQISLGDRIFRVNDKVMQIKNNYDIEWRTKYETGNGIYNGDIGKITAVDNEAEMVRVVFDDGKEVEYDTVQLEELDLAYATTVHKSQGSEFPVVVIPVFMGGQKLMTRNLLYTAMTRAKEMLVFVGNLSSIEYMVKNLNKKERYSGLKEMLGEDSEGI